jgi:hypothetical protein
MKKTILQKRVLSVIAVVALLLSLFTWPGAAPVYAADTVTGGDTISVSGIYTVDGSVPGIITILPGITGGVTFRGTGTEQANAISGISFSVGAETAVTINELYISSPYLSNPIFDFDRIGSFDFSGTNLLESNGINNGAVLHVSPGETLDIGTSTPLSAVLYIFKSTGGTAVGGSPNEASGEINFNGGTVLIKGSRVGAAVGGGDYAAGPPANGDISFNGGNINITTISQGAGVGSGRGTGVAGDVYLNGGNLSVTCDANGVAFGNNSGSVAGNLYINGGSLEISLTTNSRLTPDTAIAGSVYDLTGAPGPIPFYYTPADPAVGAEISLDGQTDFFSGKVNPWTFIRGFSTTKDSWTDVDTTVTTPTGEQVSYRANKSVYLYVPSGTQDVYIDGLQTPVHSVAFKYDYPNVRLALDQFFPRGAAFTLDPFAFRVDNIFPYTSTVTAQDADLLAPSTNDYIALKLGADPLIAAQGVPGLTVSFTAANADVYVDDQVVSDAPVEHGGSLTFVVLPYNGYRIGGVTTGGTALAPNADGSYTVSGVASDITVAVTAVADSDAWSANADISWYTNAPAGTTVFTLYNPEELAGLARIVNNGTDNFSGKTILLGNDIDLGNNEWTPIGGASAMQGYASREERMFAAYLASGGDPLAATAPRAASGDPEDYGLGPDDPIPAELKAGTNRSVPTGEGFSGVFDGQGRSVRGLSVTRLTPKYGAYGLFGYVNGGTVQNLTVFDAGTGATGIRSGGSVVAVGGVVGYTTGSLYNITNNARVLINGEDTVQTGGVAGVVDSSGGAAAYVQFCVNNADVNGSSDLGGLVGGAYSELNGGVVIDQSYNTGDVTADVGYGRSYVGGLVGYDEGYILNSYNTGDVAANLQDARFCVGGLAGLLNGGEEPYAAIRDSFNTGDVSTDYSPIPAQPLFAYADESNKVIVENCVYLQPMTQDPLGATLVNVQAVSTGVMGDTTVLPGALSALYFTPGSPQPTLNWTGQTGVVGPIYVDPNASGANPDGTITNPYSDLTSALAAQSVYRGTIYLMGPLTGPRFPSVINMTTDNARIARGNGNTGDLFGLLAEQLDFTGGVIEGQPSGPLAVTGSLIRVDGGEFSLGAGATLRGNNNSTSGGTSTTEGGAIYALAGTVTLNGGYIIGNKSDYGGGICVERNATVTMYDGVNVNDNDAHYGGAFYVLTDGTVNVEGGTMDGNFAFGGGGVYTAGGAVSFNGASAISGSNSYGGSGVYVNGGSFTMNGGRLIENGNQATNGGGVYVNAGTFTMNNGGIDANSATTNGGGVYLTGTGLFELKGGAVSGNKTASANGGGGGVYIAAGGTLDMTGGSINANSAANGRGVYVTQSGALTLAPSGPGVMSFGSGDTIYLPYNSSATPEQVSFNIGADLDTGLAQNTNVPLAFQTPLPDDVVAIARSDTMAENSYEKLVSGSILFYPDDIYIKIETTL